MRFTYRAAGPIGAAAILILLTACSRTQQDWRVAQQADTAQAYKVFTERHLDSELASVANQRIAQLTEEAVWQQATRVNTAAAYQNYLAKYPNGSWSQDARIRMESKSLAGQASQGTGGAASAATWPASAPGSPGAGAYSAAGQTASATSQSGSPASAADAPIPAARSLRAASSVRKSTAVTNAGRSTVQLGAFSSVANARTAWRQLSSKFRPELQGLTPQVVVVMLSGRRLYRLEARVTDRVAALRLCRQLEQHSQGCIPVP